MLLGLFLGMTLFGGVFGIARPAAALDISTEYNDIRSQGIIFANVCPTARPDDGEDTCTCRAQGQCSIEDILQVFVNVSYLILALSGTAALIAFVYGGFEWVISAGNPDRVKRGKDALTGAFIGLVIVFGAYAFINLLIGVLKTGSPPTTDIEDTISDSDNNATTIINTEEPQTAD